MGYSGISWTICKQSAPRFRQTITPTPHRSNFYRPDAFPNAQPTVSKHRRHNRLSHKPTLFFSSSAVIDFVLSSLTSRSLCSFSSPISLLSSERSCSHSPACSCFAPHTHTQRVCCVVVLSHVIGELRYGPLGRGFGGSECRRRVIG